MKHSDDFIRGALNLSAGTANPIAPDNSRWPDNTGAAPTTLPATAPSTMDFSAPPVIEKRAVPVPTDALARATEALVHTLAVLGEGVAKISAALNTLGECTTVIDGQRMFVFGESEQRENLEPTTLDDGYIGSASAVLCRHCGGLANQPGLVFSPQEGSATCVAPFHVMGR
jgi:hypothetical protein